MSRLPALLSCLVALSLAACAPASAPSIRLAVDGPPLLVAAKGETSALQGAMDRTCMAGVGSMLLYSRQESLSCKGEMDRPATDKGRLYMDLTCSDGRSISFVMRNLGPDQGMGIGRINETDEQILLFYHPCEDEARRRLAQLREDIDRAREEKKKRESEQTPP